MPDIMTRPAAHLLAEVSYEDSRVENAEGARRHTLLHYEDEGAVTGKAPR